MARRDAFVVMVNILIKKKMVMVMVIIMIVIMTMTMAVAPRCRTRQPLHRRFSKTSPEEMIFTRAAWQLR